MTGTGSQDRSHDACRAVFPSLGRVAEGEATPDEAMRTARHLSDCTACRILLARERRLAAMLEEGLADPLQVGEDFVRAVMDTLPNEPPPPPDPRKRKRRLLRLASFLGLAGLTAFHATTRGGSDGATGGLWTLVPDLDAPAAAGSLEAAERLGSLLLLALGRVVAGLGSPADLGLGGLLPGVALLPFLLVAALASASVILLAMGGLLERSPSGPA